MSIKFISGFPGIGKTMYKEKYAGKKRNYDFKVSDSDSSKFSWMREWIRDYRFPQNYIDHLLKIEEDYDYVFVSSHKEVRQALVDNGIFFVLVIPHLSLKQEYLKRYKKRGSSPEFIDMMDKNWEKFILDCEAQTNCTLYELESGQFLTDIF